MSESLHIKGVPSVLHILAFMHGHGHSELAKKLNDNIPKTVDGMFKRVRAFSRGEVAAGSAEKVRPSQGDKGKKETTRDLSKKEVRSNEQTHLPVNPPESIDGRTHHIRRNYRRKSSPKDPLYLCRSVLGYRCIRTELMTPDLVRSSTHQLLRSTGGDSGPDVSFDKSASPKVHFSQLGPLGLNKRRAPSPVCIDENRFCMKHWKSGDGGPSIEEQADLFLEAQDRVKKRALSVHIFLDFAWDTLSLEGFIDWLVAVEEVFEFKEVPKNKRVSLIATKIHSRASALWQQLKLIRERVGKTRITKLAEDDDAAYEEYEEASVYDEEPEYEEENVFRDVGVNLVVRRSCLTPKADGDDWLKHNIFQSTCTISGKIQWLKKGGEVTVSKCVHVPFSVGNTYKDNVWCDVVPMDACHLLLGRPWEYDRDITHNGRTNTYSFLFRGVKITLMPNKPKEVVSKPIVTLLTLLQFEDELEMGDDVFMLIGKEVDEDSEIPKAMIPLLEEFSDVFPD
ncbi:hypothetical protein Tco_0172428 [Tanacetum coccineum]